MTRSTPDAVFAAAAQAELERRVRLARPVAAGAAGGAEPRSRRSWTMELAAVAGVTALVAAAAVGVTVLRPTATPDQAPAALTSPTADAPPTASPSASASPSGTATPPPTTPPPATTAPPSVPVSTAPPSPSAPLTSPPTSGAGPSGLIGPTGARVRTDAEIRAWTASIGFSEIWGEEAVLDMHCMADKGFLYDPIYDHEHGIATAGMTAAQQAAFSDAYSGPQTDQPYDWRTAGCHGRSVHLMGQDDAH